MVDETILDRLDALVRIMDERDRRYAQQFCAVRERMDHAIAAWDKAVLKAEAAADKRFDSVNEFRAQMNDMQATFVRTDIVEAKIGALDKKIDSLMEYRSNIMGRFGALSDAWGWLIGFIGVVIAIATYLFKGP